MEYNIQITKTLKPMVNYRVLPIASRTHPNSIYDPHSGGTFTAIQSVRLGSGKARNDAYAGGLVTTLETHTRVIEKPKEHHCESKIQQQGH